MMEEEKEVQVFNDEDYFLYDSLKDNDIKYNYFAKVSDPNEILVAIEENDEYIILEEDEYNLAMKLYYERHNIV